MHPLMKRAAIVFIILSSLPFMTGILIQRQYNKLLLTLVDLSQVVIQSKEYHRGWFHSRAVSEVIFPQKDTGAPIVIQVEHFISHGPRWHHRQLFLADIESHLSPVGDQPSLPFHTKMGVTGNTEIVLTVPQLALKSADQKIDMAGKNIEAYWYFSKKFSEMEWHFSAESLNILVDDQEVLHLIDFYTEKLMHKNAQSIWVGGAKWRARQLLTKGLVQGSDLSVQDIHFQREVENSEHFLKLQYQGSIDRFEYQQELYGPLKLAMTIDRLNPQSMILIDKWIQDMRYGRLAQNDTSFESAALLLSEVAEYRPQLTVTELQLDLPLGFMQGTARLNFGGPGAANIRDPAIFMRSIAGVINLEASPKLTQTILGKYLPPDEKLETYIQTLEQDKVLALVNGLYQFDLELKNGKLLFNGMPHEFHRKDEGTP